MIQELGAPASSRRPAPSVPAATTGCRICFGPWEKRIVVAREMMFGLGDEFEYLECSGCGCLQLREPPADLARYYPPEYYAFAPPAQSSVTRWLKQVRIRHLFARPTPLGAALVWLFGVPADGAAVLRSRARFDDAVLDVGCGDGRLLRELASAGFVSLTGIDPHLPQEVRFSGVVVRRAALGEVSGAFDLIMLHHAFEHVPDPEATLGEVRRLLRPTGRLILRIPLADSYAWRHYGTDWVQLDAPRHTFLHTRQSIRILAERTGFRVRSVDFDSTAFQFWGSEQYRRGLPLRSSNEPGDRPRRDTFSRRQLREFTRLAEELNRREEGDQASFCLEKQP